MEFQPFKNSTHYAEYLQIFCFQRIMVHQQNDVNLDEYATFELTDQLIDAFNRWIASGSWKNSEVANWLRKNPEKVFQFREGFHVKYYPKVSIWSDRKKSEYYKTKLQASFLFENHIAQIIEQRYGIQLGQYLTPEGQYELGENALGIEIKNDTLIEKYGNVYIEYQEKSGAANADFVNSGILKDDNCRYFLTGTPHCYYIFRKSRLKQVFYDELRKIKIGLPSERGVKFKEIATSKGFVYPVKYAVNDVITMDVMIEEIKSEQYLKRK
jgi:hypothetical protein